MSEYRIEEFNGGFDVFQDNRFVLHTTTRNQAEIVIGMLAENERLRSENERLTTHTKQLDSQLADVAQWLGEWQAYGQSIGHKLDGSHPAWNKTGGMLLRLLKNYVAYLEERQTPDKSEGEQS